MAARRRLLLLLAALAATAARSAGPSSEDELLGDMAAKVVPFTLSADGRTRLHVDSHHVLHRVALADPTQERHLALPFAVRALAASRTGQKVALRSDAGCVGLVDFGATGTASTPTLRWLDASFPEHQAEPASTPEPWSDRAPDSCAPPDQQSSGNLGWPTLALAIDGRLLATEHQVVDTETHRLVASLRGAPMRLRFLDGGRRLLAQGVVTSSGYESYPNGLSEVNLAVWDLATGSLEGVERHRMEELTPAALNVELPSDTAALAWVVDDQGATRSQPALVLHRWDAMGCGRSTDAGIALAPSPEATDAAWLLIDRLVVDPLGRWVATFRRFRQGDVLQAELVVQALDDGRVLWRRKLADPVGGAVATPDGTRLLGLSFSPTIPNAADGVRASGDAVLEFPIDVQGLRAVAPLADTPRCGVDGAPPEARNVARPVHALTPLWQRVLDPVVPVRAGEPIANAPACTSPETFDIQGDDDVFFRPDGTLWVDRFSKLAQLDPATGKTVRTLPTPRSPLVCSVVSPAADGFFNVQGDTLTWRPLEAGSTPRRVIDQRPGWTAIELGAFDRAVRVGWVAREGVVKPAADGNVDDFVVALYAPNGRRVSQQAQSYGGYGEVGDSAAPLYAPAFMPPCADAGGPIVDALAWQVDVFGSLRARACGAAGAPARTLLWTETDIRPRPGTPRNYFPDSKAAAHDGAIAVMQDQRGLHVFDVNQRRELGQVTWSDGHVTSMAVSAAQSLLVVKEFISSDNGHQVVLTAYRLR